jgi:hypothetical protein
MTYKKPEGYDANKNSTELRYMEYAWSWRYLAFFLWLPYFNKPFIIERFAEVLETVTLCLGFVQYFFNTWMNCIEWWTVKADDGILTNSGIEVFHRDLKKELFGKAHPHWTKLQAKLNEFDKARVKRAENASDYNPTKDVCPRRALMLSAPGVVEKEVKLWARAEKPCVGSDAPGQRIGVEWIRKKVAEKGNPNAEGKEALMAHIMKLNAETEKADGVKRCDQGEVYEQICTQADLGGGRMPAAEECVYCEVEDAEVTDLAPETIKSKHSLLEAPVPEVPFPREIRGKPKRRRQKISL